jgi:predicted ATPase
MWLGFGRVIAGWSSGIQGSYEDGEKLLRMGIKNLESASPNPHKPLFLMLLAEIYISGGETRRAIDSLTSALKLVEQTDERIWESGVNCLLGKAQLIHETNISEKAEANLIQAIKVAAAQNAKTLELRAAVSLTQEWLNRGKRDEARDLISPIYNWFTEGFDTPDLIEARKLLELLI